MRSERHLRRTLGTWGSIRRWEAATRDDLRRRHWLWLHGWCIGFAVLLLMWAVAHLQMVMGSHSLALRYGATLGVGYLGFLVMLRWWAGLLVGERSDGDLLDAIDLPGNLPLPRGTVDRAADVLEPLRSGGGGDFGGGGASGSFDLSSDSASAIGDIASGAADAVGGSDEGAVVVIPVVVVFLAGCLVVFGAGALLLLYFGSDVLLAVAIEIAFGYVSARTAIRLAREGWLNAAVRLTWKPLLGALVCGVLLGALIDHFVPKAHSLPQAVKLLRVK